MMASSEDYNDVISENYTIKNQVNVSNNVIGSLNVHVHNEANRIKYPVKFHLSKPVHSFYGRDKELSNLDQLFTQYNKVVISGMAGIGKSELARKFATINLEKYEGNIIWISAETADSLKQSFSELGKVFKLQSELDLLTIVEEIYSKIKTKKVLFIFDNALSRQSLKNFFPNEIETNINFLITSQYDNWNSDIPTLQLKTLSIDAALQIFESTIDANCIKYNKIHFAELANMLNCIPLALQISAAYLQEEFRIAKQNCEKFTVQNYILRLKKEEDKLLNEHFPQNSENSYSSTIYIAVKMSLENIERLNNKESKQALDLLFYCSYLDPDEILDSELEMLGFGDNLSRIFTILKDFSFINLRHVKEIFVLDLTYDVRAISMHRLIQWTLREHQKRCKIGEKYYQRILDVLVFNKNFTPNDYFSMILPEFSKNHCKTVFKQSENFADECVKCYRKYKPNLIEMTFFDEKISDYFRILIKNECLIALKKIFNSEWSFKISYLINKYRLLHFAAKFKSKSTLELLLNYNSSINSKDNDGNTPLHIANKFQNAEIISFLIEKGAKVNSTNLKNETPLHIIGYRPVDDVSPVLTCVKLLVNEGKAKLDMKTNEGFTALHFAAKNIDAKVIFFLINKGADINATDNNGQTILFLLLKRGNFHKSKVMLTFPELIEKGAKLNHTDNKGRICLHIAAENGMSEVVEFLIDKELSVDSCDDDGRTVLFYLAHFHGNEANLKSTLKVLLDKGANLEHKDNFGETPIEYAKTKNNIILVNWLNTL